MKKFSTVSFLLGLLLLQWSALSQAQDVRFSKVFYNPESGMHVLASAEAGQDSLMMISSQYGVHLMDVAGVMHWSKNLVREGSWVMPIDIARTSDQNFLICASENMNGTKKSLLLIKLNVAGEILWVKKYEHDIDVVPSGIALSAGGDILVTGNSDPPGGFTSQLLLLRFTADGALLWAKSYESASFYDGGLAVAELYNEHLIVGGYTKGIEPYSAEMSLTQTDASGNVVWAKRKVTTEGYPPLSQVGDLIAGPSGFYLCGYAYYDAAGMVMAMDTNGETIWSKSLNTGAFGWYESAYRGRINTTASGDLLVAFGSHSIDGVVCQLTSDGNAIWSQNVFMSPIEAKAISDGGYLFIGLGPLLGVKEDPSQPQTGIVRTNASGEGVSCTYGYTANLEVYVPVFENLNYTAVTEVGSAVDYSLQWEEFLLDSFGGCVTFLGAVEEIPDAANALKVYPNPGNEPFRLLIEDMLPESLVQLTVFNSKGQSIFSREGAWSRVQMIDRKLPAGVYLIRLKTEKSLFTTRLIVNR